MPTFYSPPALQAVVLERDDSLRTVLSEQEQWRTQWQRQRKDMLTEAAAHEAEIEQFSLKCRRLLGHIATLEEQQQQQQQQNTMSLSLPMLTSSSAHPQHSHQPSHGPSPVPQYVAAGVPWQGLRPFFLNSSSSASSSSSTLFNLSQSAVSTPRSILLECDNHSVGTDTVGLPVLVDDVMHVLMSTDDGDNDRNGLHRRWQKSVEHGGGVVVGMGNANGSKEAESGLGTGLSSEHKEAPGMLDNEYGMFGSGAGSGAVAKSSSPFATNARSPTSPSFGSFSTPLLFQPLSFEPKVTPLAFLLLRYIPPT